MDKAWRPSQSYSSAQDTGMHRAHKVTRRVRTNGLEITRPSQTSLQTGN